MPPVAPPTRVGDRHWPVLSAVRVSTAEQPAEFVVLADCGQAPPPRGRYATFRVYVWPGHSETERGVYDLTFTQAQRSLADRAGLLPSSTVEIIVVRDPDHSNDHTIVIDGRIRPDGTSRYLRVITHDIDLGADDITPGWVAAELRRTQALSPAAAAHARDVIAMSAEDNGLDVP